MRSVVVGLALAVGLVAGAQANPLSGDYGARSATRQLHVRITETDKGVLSARVVRTSERCIGDVGGILEDEGAVMSLISGQCVIKIRRLGRGLKLEEGLECSALHGADCDFDGTVERLN